MPESKIHIIKVLFLTCAMFFISIKNIAQEVRIIDNKGTINTVNNNNVFTSATDPNIPTPVAVENDIWFDTSTTPNTFRIWDGTTWLNISATSSGWLINGNSGTTNTNFLGTIDDVRMQIRSFNIPILEFGRRGTLGLVDAGRTDYDDANQSLVYVNGENGVSALQFRADGAAFYNPIFFTTPNGSFRLKGSSGRTDFFEIGSAGPDNDGRLEFIIADDGNEPIVFKRFDYRSGEFYREFFRVQGSNTTENAKTRFGININQNNYPVSGNITAASNGGSPAKIMANSTLQVEGSVSKSIQDVSSNLTLTEDHHTISVTANATITFPAANSCEGRIYVIKNISGGTINSSNYQNQSNTTTSTIANNSVIRIQSDGTNWISINNNNTSTNNNWSLTGNSGTNPINNFVGTTDAQDLVLRTNNTEALRINQTNQYVGIGISATSPLHISKDLPDGVGILRVQGTEPDIIFNDTNGGFNTFTFENAGTPRFAFGRRNTNAFYITRNDGTWHDETFNILNNNGFVGLNTDAPTERLDVNGKLRVRDITEVTTNNDILTVDTDGVVEKKKLLGAETDNQIESGANGGVYLGPTVYTGSFTINAPGGVATTTFTQEINGLPFQPSQITFVAHPNIRDLNTDSNNGTSNNTTRLDNTYGTMNGFIRSFGGTTTQSVIFSGGSGSSINNISRFSSNTNCIGIRYTNQNGQNMGKITASLDAFLVDGYRLSITYSLGTSTDGGGGAGRIDRNNDVMDENLVVFYTAYK